MTHVLQPLNSFIYGMIPSTFLHALFRFSSFCWSVLMKYCSNFRPHVQSPFNIFIINIVFIYILAMTSSNIYWLWGSSDQWSRSQWYWTFNPFPISKLRTYYPITYKLGMKIVHDLKTTPVNCWATWSMVKVMWTIV